MFVIRVSAALLLVLAASSQRAQASISYHDGAVHQISGDTLGDGIQVSNFTVVEVYGGAESNCGSLDVSGGGIFCFEGFAVQSVQPAGTASVVPEPNTMIIWSALGGLGIVIGWRRRNRAV